MACVSVEELVHAAISTRSRACAWACCSRNRAASASIDLSDGLADGVHRIAEASGVGAVIDADALPIDPGVRAWFEERGLDPVAEAMTAGDDYELLVTVRPRNARRLAAATRW